MNLIHILWSGPYSLTSLREVEEAKNYGLYQIYGTHPVYGADQLLYIGIANYQPLDERLRQHSWWITDNPSGSAALLRIGRIQSESRLSDEEWGEHLIAAEKLLIFSHAPALNTSNLNSLPWRELERFHVINHGSYGSLLPEVSGACYCADHEKLKVEVW